MTGVTCGAWTEVANRPSEQEVTPADVIFVDTVHARPPEPREQFLSMLGRVLDPRDPRRVRYPLAGVLAVAVTATLADARSFGAIGQWVADAPAERLARFGITGRAPDESTLRKLFALLDADALDRALGVWM